ncbi:bifunctional metallophosphatase/5'-nucleotidase [Kiloniella sp.]|uniref:bifunctional metallophosphatase/5'-nucleotidase n=1 Tax=Kiloniella sp. TaxID=1938587 RepID=UPI003B011624
MRQIPIRIILICGIVLGAIINSTPVWADYSLTVLHINDLHSRILPINKYNNTCNEEDLLLKKCFGGYARLAKEINARREALLSQGNESIFLHGGDDFEGSIFYARFQGLASVELLNQMNLDAMALGNHEFDGGPGVLRRFLSKANFPVISANTIFDDSSVLKGQIKTHVILDRGGEEIAVIGAITEDTAELSNAGNKIHFGDATEALRDLVTKLESEGINKIILLSHLGFKTDKVIATKISGIDLIVGAHSKTLLSNNVNKADGPYPVLISSPNKQPTPIVQAYGYGKYYGEITLTFDDNGNVTSSSGDTVLLDQGFDEDPDIKNQVDALNRQLDDIRKTKIGVTTATLNGLRSECRVRECTMGNMVADAMLWRFKKRGVEIVIQNGGGLRASISSGSISWGQILTVLPFRNRITLLKVSGTDIITALENGFSQTEDIAGRFPQVAGMRVQWDPEASPGHRVLSVEIGNKETGFSPLEFNRMYLLATNDYLAKGGDGYDIFATDAITSRHLGPRLEDAVAEYLAKFSPITVRLEDRIQIK